MNTTAAQNIITSQVGVFTIIQDRTHFTVKITRPSKGRFDLGTKTVAYYGFKRTTAEASIEAMEKYVNSFVTAKEAKKMEKEMKAVQLKEARAAFKNPYKVGDLFYNSWGYEQTNIDFYQVVEVKPKSVVIRAIDSERNFSGQDHGTCAAIRDSFKGEPVVKIIQVAIYNGKTHYGIGLQEYIEGRELSWSSWH